MFAPSNGCQASFRIPRGGKPSDSLNAAQVSFAAPPYRRRSSQLASEEQEAKEQGRSTNGDKRVTKPEAQSQKGGQSRRPPSRAGQEALKQAMQVFHRCMFSVGAFSVAINFLMLSVPIYLFQF